MYANSHIHAHSLSSIKTKYAIRYWRKSLMHIEISDYKDYLKILLNIFMEHQK